MRCVWPCRSAPETLGEPRDAAYGVPGGPRRFSCATASYPAFTASFGHPRHPSRVPPRLAHCSKTVHMPPNTMPSSPHPRKSSSSTRSFLAFPRKSSPSAPENSVFWVFWACRANFFAQKLLTAWRDETVNTNPRTSARLRETRDSFAHQDSAENGCFCLAMVPSVSPETEHAPAKVLTVSREPTRRTLLNAGCLRGLVGRGENAQPCPECAITVDVVPMQRVSLEV